MFISINYDWLVQEYECLIKRIKNEILMIENLKLFYWLVVVVVL